MKLEQTFQVEAPIERVWEALIDVERVAPCLPGAEITGAARDALLADLQRRPQDYVGQEIVRLSTMPVVLGDALVPRPFTLRVFAARGADGAWTVMPGGFARIGEHPDPRAAVMGATGTAAPGIYELGGPEILTTRQIVGQVLSAVHRRRAVVNLPFPIARLASAAMGVAQAVTGGLFTSPLSRDQLALLRKDNVVTPGARGFADLGIVPTAAGSVLDDYLVRFRPSGQYDSIKRSAKNLREH